MKKLTLILIQLLLASGLLFAQDATNDVTITNVETVILYETNHIEVVTNMVQIEVPIFVTNVVVVTNSIALEDDSAFKKIEDKVTLHYVISPENGSQLMQSAHMKNGKIKIEDNNVIIYGLAYIEIPIQIADHIEGLKPPAGLSYKNMIGEAEFSRSSNGFEGDVTFKR